MTSMTKSLLGASALCALLAVAGCTQNSPSSNGGYAPPPNNQPPVNQGGPTPNADPGSPTSTGMTAPVT